MGASVVAAPVAVEKEFSWRYKGLDHSLSVELPGEAYLHYRSRPRVWRYGSYVTESAQFPVIADFATTLSDQADQLGYSDWEKVSFALAFVQGLKYETEEGEYPRYPIETLMEGKGDCEDTSILLAAILDAWGFDCVLLSPPGHMALGLAISGMQGGVYFPWAGKRYYYMETTGDYWEIGQVPDQYTGQTRVIELETVAGPRHALAYEAPAEMGVQELKITFTRTFSGDGGKYAGRTAYKYSVGLEGPADMLDFIKEVRYQRQHATFPEYREGAWLRTSRGNDFKASWTAWGHSPIAVQIELYDGEVVELMVEQPPFIVRE